MVSPTKMPSLSLPPLVMRKIFGIGQVGVYVSSRATARGDKISMPCAASPPSTFCQEKVATSSFGQSKSGAIGGDPIRVWDARAGCRAVPGEDDVACRIDGGKIWQFAIGRAKHGDV